MRRASLLAAAIAVSASLWAGRASADGGEELFDLSGSWKTIAGSLQFPADDDYSDILSRLRLRLDASWSPSLSAAFIGDIEGHFGDFAGSGWFALGRKMQPQPFFDLDVNLIEEDDMFVRAGIYRALVSWKTERADIVIGRQTIDWGTGRAWNVTNPFFPANFLLIEPEERAGTDAVSVSLPVGDFARCDIVAAGRRGSDEPVLALRWRANLRGTDLALLAVRDDSSASFGADFSRSVGNAELHGALLLASGYGSDRDFVKAQAGVDWTFANSLKLFAEYLYNGAGEAHSAFYDWASLLGGTVSSLGRDYGYLGFEYELTSLLRIQNTFIVNLNDGGWFVHPCLKYALSANTELAAGWASFHASGGDEFAQYPDTAYLHFVWYF